MDALLSIGDFSRMTYLSVKALRHYHEHGLLEPARVDPDSGYRFYRADQVATAQIIRRFRDLGMPLDEIRTMVHAPDVETRNAAIVAHLDRMETQLAQTRDTVVSLRTLLQGQPARPDVVIRQDPALPVLAIEAEVEASEAVGWWMSAFQELHRTVGMTGRDRTGPDGALFVDDFFTAGGGTVTAFVPVSAGRAPFGRAVEHEIPSAAVAVLVHDGPFSDLDRTYGELGTWVAERSAGAPGPVRERYLPLGRSDDLLNHRTEVCWPVAAE